MNLLPYIERSRMGNGVAALRLISFSRRRRLNSGVLMLLLRKPLLSVVCVLAFSVGACQALVASAVEPPHTTLEMFDTMTSEEGPVEAERTSPGVGMMVFVQQATWARDLKETVASGATWIRMDIPIGVYGNVSNGAFTPNQAQVDFYRSAAQQADAAGLKIVLVMAAAYNNDSWSEAQFRDYNGQYWKAVSKNIGQYVDLWQIFNEHDGRDYRNNAPISLTAAYLTRFRDTLASARTALRMYSSAPLTTTPFGYPVNEARYTKWQTFFDGVGPSLDVIGVHAYPEKSAEVIGHVPTYIKRLKARYNKPVAVLEFGLPSVASYGTSAEVGKAIAHEINAIMGAAPMTATLYELRDRGTDTNNGEMVFGILRDDFSKKDYYDTVVAEVKRWR
jgi:arabinogalactan endo-1,4-beta-galactosidase